MEKEEEQSMPGDKHTNMRPINQILRREDWQTGKDVKGRVHGVVSITDAEDGGIGREAGDNGIHVENCCRWPGRMSRCIHWLRKAD